MEIKEFISNANDTKRRSREAIEEGNQGLIPSLLSEIDEIVENLSYYSGVIQKDLNTAQEQKNIEVAEQQKTLNEVKQKHLSLIKNLKNILIDVNSNLRTFKELKRSMVISGSHLKDMGVSYIKNG